MKPPGLFDRRITGSFPERFDTSAASATRVIAGGGMRGRGIRAFSNFSEIAKGPEFLFIAFSSREPVPTSLENALVPEFGLDLGVEGLRQHGAAGLGLLARRIERDMRENLGEIAQGEIDGRHQPEHRLGGSSRLLRKAERNDLTHRHTHAESESAFSVRGQSSESG